MPSNQLYLSFYYSFPIQECSIKISLHIQDSGSITFTVGLCPVFCTKYICAQAPLKRKETKSPNNFAGSIFSQHPGLHISPVQLVLYTKLFQDPVTDWQ